MDDCRLDAALDGLAKNVPRPPEMSVDAMIRTVKALNTERARRKALNGEAPAARNKDLSPRAEIKEPGVKKIF